MTARKAQFPIISTLLDISKEDRFSHSLKALFPIHFRLVPPIIETNL